VRSGLDPKLDGVSENFRKTGPIREVIGKWNREEYGKFMRRMEVLLVRGQKQAAMRALRAFSGWCDPSPVSLESSVIDTLPIRLANLLEERGYDTLADCNRATDEQLRSHELIGYHAVLIIRMAIQAAKHGRRIEYQMEKFAPKLVPEFDIDWEYLAFCEEGKAND
jgi:hypothetical protein